jgi:hypothetical protein
MNDPNGLIQWKGGITFCQYHLCRYLGPKWGTPYRATWSWQHTGRPAPTPGGADKMAAESVVRWITTASPTPAFTAGAGVYDVDDLLTWTKHPQRSSLRPRAQAGGLSRSCVWKRGHLEDGRGFGRAEVSGAPCSMWDLLHWEYVGPVWG